MRQTSWGKSPKENKNVDNLFIIAYNNVVQF